MSKKTSLLIEIFLLVIAVCLNGCGNSSKVSIEDYQWEVTTIQDNDNGKVIACSDNNTESFPDAAEIALSCAIDNKGLTLTNQTDNQTYSGTYVKESSEPDSIIYSILIGEDAGTAVCAWTTYLDGSKTPTMILSIGNYTLNFEGA